MTIEIDHVKKENNSLKRKLEKQEDEKEEYENVKRQYLDVLEGMKPLQFETEKIVKEKDRDLRTANVE